MLRGLLVAVVLIAAAMLLTTCGGGNHRVAPAFQPVTEASLDSTLAELNDIRDELNNRPMAVLGF